MTAKKCIAYLMVSLMLLVSAPLETSTALAGTALVTATAGGAPHAVSVTEVSVSPTSLVLQRGDTRNLSASVSPVDATDRRVMWSSSDTAVATVSDNGIVTARGTGRASITVRTVEGNRSALSTVTVQDLSLRTGILSSRTHVRGNPSSASEIVRRDVARGTAVTVLGSRSGWFWVSTGGVRGWIQTSHTTIRNTTGVVTVANAAVRPAPASSGNQVTSFSRNTQVVILGRASNGDWLRVRANRHTGWVRSSSIVALSQHGVMTAGSTVLRSGAGTRTARVGSVARNRQVSILGRSTNGNWMHVRVGNNRGWVQSSRIASLNRSAIVRAATQLRQTNSSSSTRLNNLPRGQQVFRLGTAGNWSHVQIGTRIGWVRTNALNITSRPGRTSTSTVMRVANRNDASRIRTLSRNQNVSVIGRAGNWSLVRQGGRTGWTRTSNLFTPTRVLNPNSVAVLVNKEFYLPRNFRPNDLVRVNVLRSFGNQNLERGLMRRDAARALERMFSSMNRDGLEPALVSAFRSWERQREIYNASVRARGVTATDRIIARPGHSEHQTGLAVDISSRGHGFQLNNAFANTREGRWLRSNAHRYGFILRYPRGKEHITGYVFEPWHFRYVGVSRATSVRNSGLTFDQYMMR